MAGAGNEALHDRLDAIRKLRNQKYGGIARTRRDVEQAKATFDEFSAVAGEWLTNTHPSLLRT
jgi:hypothetical protein